MNNQELINDIQTKLNLLSKTKTVEEKIKQKILNLKKEFVEETEGHSLLDYISTNDVPLTYDQVDEMHDDENGLGDIAYKSFKDASWYELGYNELTDLIDNVKCYEGTFYNTRYKIQTLNDLLND